MENIFNITMAIWGCILLAIIIAVFVIIVKTAIKAKRNPIVWVIVGIIATPLVSLFALKCLGEVDELTKEENTTQLNKS